MPYIPDAVRDPAGERRQIAACCVAILFGLAAIGALVNDNWSGSVVLLGIAMFVGLIAKCIPTTKKFRGGGGYYR